MLFYSIFKCQAALGGFVYNVRPHNTGGNPRHGEHVFCYSWIRRPIQADKKDNFSANQKGYDNPETPVGMISERRINIYLVQFYKSNFYLSFQNNFPNNVRTSPDQTESDSRSQILTCRGLRSFLGVGCGCQMSGPGSSIASTPP